MTSASACRMPTPTSAQRMRADDLGPQPTPKKVKTERQAPRRPALRDVTNQQNTEEETSNTTQEKPTACAKDCDGGAKEEPEDEPVGVEDAVDIDTSMHSPEAEVDTQALDWVTRMDQADDIGSAVYIRLLEKQLTNRATENYLEDQPEVNNKMRVILVDWLIEVHYRFKLETQTLFLAVNYMDRYLMEAVVTRAELQLVGLAALFISAKFEETESIDVRDLVYVCDKTYNYEQIIDMERKILAVLKFNLAAATTHNFLEYIADKLQVDSSVAHMAAFFTQHALLQLQVLLCYPPSEIAASSLFLAQCSIFSKRPSNTWIHEWVNVTGYSYEDLVPCLDGVCHLVETASPKLAALTQKFSTKRFGRVVQSYANGLAAFL